MSKLAGETTGLTLEKAQAIAKELDVTVHEVIEMDARLAGDRSLNAAAVGEGHIEWEALLVYHSPDAETIVAEHDESTRQTSALHAALDVLAGR